MHLACVSGGVQERVLGKLLQRPRDDRGAVAQSVALATCPDPLGDNRIRKTQEVDVGAEQKLSPLEVLRGCGTAAAALARGQVEQERDDGGWTHTRMFTVSGLQCGRRTARSKTCAQAND